MDEKFVIVKKNNDLTEKNEVTSDVFHELLNAAHILDEFNYIAFLANNYVSEKERFLKYDFSQFNIQEIDMFSILLNSLNAIATNNNLWEAYLKRRYKNDTQVFVKNSSGKTKSVFGVKDSECYDRNVEYVVVKALRNMVVHSEKPYSDIWYDDSLNRHFIIYTEKLLQGDNLNKSGKDIVLESGIDYFDVVNVIKRAFEIVDTLNLFIFNFLLQKEWCSFLHGRTLIRSHIGIEWQGAYLVQRNSKYPPTHAMHLSTTSISKSAMNSILSIAAKSLHQQTIGTTAPNY